jgi:hypothetical protein
LIGIVVILRGQSLVSARFIAGARLSRRSNANPISCVGCLTHPVVQQRRRVVRAGVSAGAPKNLRVIQITLQWIASGVVAEAAVSPPAGCSP